MDLNAFQKAHGLRLLSLPSEAELARFLRLTPGSVPPGAFQRFDPCRPVFLDKKFSGGQIAVHPNGNTAALFLSADRLLSLLRDFIAPAEFTAF